MKTHHLNCGTMRSPGAPVICHVLLVETDNGLVLVDSGYGLEGLRRPDQDRTVAPPDPAGLRRRGDRCPTGGSARLPS